VAAVVAAVVDPTKGVERKDTALGRWFTGLCKQNSVWI